MKILLAKTAGFCMGVRRAVEMALDASGKYKEPIYTYGPLIHNSQVLSLLEEKGISVIDNIPDKGTGTVLIRAHGVPHHVINNLQKAGFDVLDATCPRVIKVQTIIKRYADQGYATIIVGDNEHPEVTGLLGYAKEKGYVVDDLKKLDCLPFFDKAIIVAQTTQNTHFFEKVKKWTACRHPEYKIFDTICDSTTRRQAEVSRLAGLVDTIVVVGGHNSGNTKRLAEIARHTGKTAYHIEEESELDLSALSSAQNIGITAGASTPNWIIKRVYRTLEMLPFNKGNVWQSTFFKIQRTFLLTNIYLALGAGCLCYSCSKLLGITDHIPCVLISILYVQSMHILNNLTGSKADHYNDPARASFYNRYKIYLALIAIISGGAGLMIAYIMGRFPFFILLAMSILGLSYNLKLVPGGLAKNRYQRIRDIPGSKTILIALAWGIVTSVFPPLYTSGSMNLAGVIVFIWFTCMVFVRTAFFDILDMQGDRIVGKETIPILLGEKTSIRLLKTILIIISAIILLSCAFKIVPSLGFFLVVCPVLLTIVLFFFDKGYMLPGIKLEFLIETHFVLAGIITYLWSIFHP